jgi:hypothetical protein
MNTNFSAMKNFVGLLGFTGLLFVNSSFMLMSGNDSELTGVWVRKSDNLRIQVTEQDASHYTSFIVAEGKEDFPCDVAALPIYKNIIKLRHNLWTCDFLVVTMGSCATDYEEGIIQITKNGEMEITCPGYEKKLYSKAKPRYEGQK